MSDMADAKAAADRYGKLSEVQWHISLALDRARREKGWSVKDVTERVGTSHAMWCRLMRPRADEGVTLRTLSRFADALDLVMRVQFVERGEP